MSRWRPTVGTSFLLVGITAAQAILLARSLGPAARGEYAAAISYTRILTFIGLLGANFAIVRRAALAEGNLVGISRAAVRLGALTGLGTMVVVSLLSLFALPPGKQHLAWLAVLCASTLPWEHIRLNLMAVDQGSGRFRRFNAGRLVAAAALPLLLAGALVFGRLSVREATLLLIPATLIGLAFRLAWSDDRRPWLAGKPATRVLAREGLPYATSVVASDLFNRFDTLLILWMANLTQQGYYAAAVPAVQLLVVAPEALALFAFNAGVKSKRTHDARRMVWIAAALLAFQVVAAVIYSLILGRLITLVYGAAFQGATRFAMILLPGQALPGMHAGGRRLSTRPWQGRRRHPRRAVGANRHGRLRRFSLQALRRIGRPLGRHGGQYGERLVDRRGHPAADRMATLLGRYSPRSNLLGVVPWRKQR